MVAKTHLWQVAKKEIKSEDNTIAQTMYAIFKDNPEAFRDKNMNGLYLNTNLQIPNGDMVNKT